ncbi:helix-turn-helix domain-containing protein [Nakamurella sp.]|uniref:helix-turn-helix domain-containing protein n=1 Tax=Nakamurella sp. TaxID=1869182 RepID=UPI003B3B18B5
MRDLTVRLDALDPAAGAALRVIAYFDDLVAHGAGLPAIVRGAAILAACPAALVDPGQQVRVRIGPGGVAGVPGPRDEAWPWTPVPPDGGELWLERDGEPSPVDAMVLERAAAAIGSIRSSAGGRGGRRRTSAHADLAVLIDADAPPAARAAAAARRQLGPTARVRAIASGAGVRIGAADDPVAGPERAGVGPSGPPDELPASAAAARLALRLTADGTPADPGPRVVHAQDVGGLLVLAAAIGPTTPRHADVVMLDRLAADHPWLPVTLTAAAEQASLRGAATALHVHHSTLQERIAHAERLLGWTIGDPAGRLRLQIALALRRLHRTAGRAGSTDGP